MNRMEQVAELPKLVSIEDDQKKRRELKMDSATYNYDGTVPIPQRVILMPEFEAIWHEIKTWDIGVPYAYLGHRGATGDAVYAILKALSMKGLISLPETAKVGS